MVLIGSGYNTKDYYVGIEAIDRRRMLRINYPIERGQITNFDDMEQIWHHTFHEELKVAPEIYNVILTEPCMNFIHYKEIRERTNYV